MVVSSPSSSGGSATGAATCPMRGAGGKAEPPPSATQQGSCPFRSGAVEAKNEEMDPRNMMPVLPQTPADQQNVDLSKQRATSSIPKTGEECNWVYPSPQQFYHALLRKNKDVDADAMEDVVHVHNVTNERTWEKIMDWERLHEKTCPTPSLIRFVGRSEDLSWGAWWSSSLSYRGAPFDRHDWFVDRCGQKTVRYVIDYYDDPRARNKMQITIEARPGVDSLGDAVDRLRRPVWQAQRMWASLFGSGVSEWGP